jgi:hypothetical protein
MNCALKNRFALAFSALLSLYLWGCGMGTEIGNGAKPKPDDERKKTSHNSARTESESVDSILIPEQPMEERGGDGDVADSDTANDAAKPGGVVARPENFDLRALLAPCGSPLGQIAAGAITLASEDQRFQISATLTDEAFVVTDNVDESYIVHQRDQLTGEVALVNQSDGAAVESPYLCVDAIFEQSFDDPTHGTVSKRSLELDNSGSQVALTWYLSGANVRDYQLVKIELAVDQELPIVFQPK